MRPFLSVLTALLICAAAGAAELRSSRSRHYDVRTDLPPKVAQPLIDHMDAVFDQLQERFAGFQRRTSAPARLYLFSSERDYLAALAARGQDATNTAGMCVYTRDEISLSAWVTGAERHRLLHTLQHEGFHQFAFMCIGRSLPVWANEGLGEYFGEGLLIDGRFELGLVPEGRLLRLKQAIRTRRVLPFADMLAMPLSDWNARVAAGDGRGGAATAASLQYDQAWGMVHFFLHAERGKYAPMFEDYLRLLATRTPSPVAFSRAFGVDSPEAFEQAWTRFILQLEPDPLSSAVERLSFLGHGLMTLHNARVVPANMDELRRELTDRRFRLMISDGMVRRELSSSDPRLFQAPFDRGRQTRLDLIPANDPGLPPALRITGLRATALLIWWRGADGKPEREIIFK